MTAFPYNLAFIDLSGSGSIFSIEFRDWSSAAVPGGDGTLSYSNIPVTLTSNQAIGFTKYLKTAGVSGLPLTLNLTAPGTVTNVTNGFQNCTIYCSAGNVGISFGGSPTGAGTSGCIIVPNSKTPIQLTAGSSIYITKDGVISGGSGSSSSGGGASSVVTANAGSNLNTSALALEGGGNLASIVTKLTSLLTQLGTQTYDVSGYLIANTQFIYENDPSYNLNQVQSGGRIDQKGAILVNPSALISSVDFVSITPSVPVSGFYENASSSGSPITTATTVQVFAAQTGKAHHFWFDYVNSGSTSTVVQVLDGATIIHEFYAASSGSGYTYQKALPVVGSVGNSLSIKTLTSGCSLYWNFNGWYA